MTGHERQFGRISQRLTGLALLLVAAAAVITFVVMERRDPSPAPTDEAARTLGGAEGTSTPLEANPPSTLGSPTSPLRPTTPRAFDVSAAMEDVRALEGFGPRGGGSAAEAQAAEYLRAQLAGMGLDARIEEFSLPNGGTSRNVIARIPGASDAVLVLGAHMDTKPPSPGANDNASGCGALLELARIFADQPVSATIEVVFYGSEETIGSDPNDHHFGSRHRVAQMSSEDRARTAGMLSIDMIGYGSEFHSRTMGKGPIVLSDMLLAHAKALGVGMTYQKDPGSSGWSDHEAYELAGIPVSWIEWRDDPVYHSAGDVSSHLQPDRIQASGALVADFVRSLDEAQLQRLLAR